jgi:hypothetical protein
VLFVIERSFKMQCKAIYYLLHWRMSGKERWSNQVSASSRWLLSAAGPGTTRERKNRAAASSPQPAARAALRPTSALPPPSASPRSGLRQPHAGPGGFQAVGGARGGLGARQCADGASDPAALGDVLRCFCGRGFACRTSNRARLSNGTSHNSFCNRSTRAP